MALDERYEIIDALHGEGGFGKVSKRRDKILERYVAVKELRMLDDAEMRNRFKREARALAQISHPNVPAIYDVIFNEDQLFIFFEFVEGNPLRSLTSDTTLPSLEPVRRWFTQVASALDHTHARNIIHRDVKPDNIIISDDHENAMLVDFGIALSVDDTAKLTQKGYVIGTPSYMSPEQARGEELDGRSDIFSLGVTLYETLSGHLPHAGGYQSLADANEAIPPAFDELIKNCLAQDKGVRVQSAQDFISRLRSAFRTDIPLSSLLTGARLHEIAAALRGMSAEDFTAKPLGQKLLLIVRLKDLLRIEYPKVQTGTAEVISLLTRLAIFENESEYQPVIVAAFEWGFDKLYGPSWQGNEEIRSSLIDAAKLVNNNSHSVLSKEFIQFLSDKDLTQFPGWYTHDLRLLVTSLLASPNCGDKAEDLAKLYDDINIASH